MGSLKIYFFKTSIASFFICYWLFVSCSVKGDRNVEITIEYGYSYRIDIENKEFTMFYMGKEPLKIPIRLTDSEKSSIVNMYYSLLLDKLPENLEVEDSCSIMPRIITVLKVKSKGQIQKISINDFCQKFYLSDRYDAKKIMEFIKYVNSIVLNKKEVKSAKPSDMIYM